jgi:hypothetical protein
LNSPEPVWEYIEALFGIIISDAGIDDFLLKLDLERKVDYMDGCLGPDLYQEFDERHEDERRDREETR